MFLLSIFICLSVAVYCFINGMVVAGVLSIVGMLPGPGIMPLLITSLLLILDEHYITAVFPVIVIINNLLWAIVFRRG